MCIIINTGYTNAYRGKWSTHCHTPENTNCWHLILSFSDFFSLYKKARNGYRFVFCSFLKDGLILSKYNITYFLSSCRNLSLVIWQIKYTHIISWNPITIAAEQWGPIWKRKSGKETSNEIVGTWKQVNKFRWPETALNPWHSRGSWEHLIHTMAVSLAAP